MLQQSQFSRERDTVATVQQKRDTLSRIDRELYNDMILEQVQSSKQVTVPAKVEFQSGQGTCEGRLPSKSSCIIECIELANIQIFGFSRRQSSNRATVPTMAQFQPGHSSSRGRVPSEGIVPVEAEFQRGKVPAEAEFQRGRVPSREELQPGQSSNKGRVPRREGYMKVYLLSFQC